MEMKDLMWMCGVLALLSAEAWSQERETNLNSTMNNSSSPLKVDVFMHLSFNKGSEVNLTSSDVMWNETIYVIWNLYLRSKDCMISFSDDHRSKDTCTDGKSLRNTSTAQSYLHIPEISEDDEGVYRCEWVYRGGAVVYEITVSVIVPPKLSAWWEHSGDKKVAVCRAEGGKPAANISWTPAVNSSSVRILPLSNGLVTAESRLELPEGMDPKNLSCSVSHPFWRDEQTVKFTIKKAVPWHCILTVGVIVVIVAGLSIFALKKIMLRRCRPADPSPSKSPPTVDVEEVEPYASYVQRVNSIYNSSADLFT